MSVAAFKDLKKQADLTRLKLSKAGKQVKSARQPTEGPRANHPITIEMNDIKRALHLTSAQLAAKLSAFAGKEYSRNWIQIFLQGFARNESQMEEFLELFQGLYLASKDQVLYANQDIRQIVSIWFNRTDISESSGRPFVQLCEKLAPYSDKLPNYSTIFRWHQANRKPRSNEQLKFIEDAVIAYEQDPARQVESNSKTTKAIALHQQIEGRVSAAPIAAKVLKTPKVIKPKVQAVAAPAITIAKTKPAKALEKPALDNVAPIAAKKSVKAPQVLAKKVAFSAPSIAREQQDNMAKIIDGWLEQLQITPENCTGTVFEALSNAIDPHLDHRCHMAQIKSRRVYYFNLWHDAESILADKKVIIGDIDEAIAKIAQRK